MLEEPRTAGLFHRRHAMRSCVHHAANAIRRSAAPPNSAVSIPCSSQNRLAGWKTACMYPTRSRPGIVNQMVQYYVTVDRAFAALADPTRRAILERLGAGSASISELAEPFGM